LAPLLELLLMLLLLLIVLLLLPALTSCCLGFTGLWHNGHDFLSPSSAAIMECLHTLQRTRGSSRMALPDATHT